jgi:hypothetical protein
MSLIKQKSTTLHETNSDNVLYAPYHPETNTIILNCAEGTIWYLSSETTQQLTTCFNVKITNVYKNMNKSIKLIFCNCNYFGNKVSICDKYSQFIFGSQDDFKFPLFFGGVPSLNINNNKYIEQSFSVDTIDNNSVCLTTIKNAF